MAKQKTEELAYTFRRNENTDETHIFEGHFTAPDGCSTDRYSICDKLDRREDNVVDIKTCLNEEEARIKAAEIGRKVCGVCVSHLYTTY